MTDVIIAASHQIVREGIAQRLREDCDATIAGEAEDGYTTIKLVRSCEVDVLLLDLGLTRPSGLETFRKLGTIKPDLKILIPSSDANIADAFMTLALGAAAFMPEQAASEHSAGAVRTIGMGCTFMPCQYLEEFVVLRRNVSRSGNMYGLSPRQLEVLRASIDGATTKEVAESLSISVRTVETHRNAIHRKTNCHDLTELSQSLQHG